MTELVTLLLTVVILTLISQYPFYLKKYKPHKYKGFWKKAGDTYKTPLQALMFPLIWLVVGLLFWYFLN